jgi:hypothetical protein
MGGAESQIKDYWMTLAQPGLVNVYQNDPQKITDIINSSWKMLQRAHMHAAAIGTAALVMSVIMANLNAGERCRQIVTFILGLGGLGYSLSWFLVALRAPVIGNVHIVKESLFFLAAPSIGMLLLGTVIVIVMGIRSIFIYRAYY